MSAASRLEAPDENTRAALIAGDVAAFEAFYATWFGRIHAYVRKRGVDRGETEDLTQEVFIALLLSLRTYSERADFESFVFGVARNVVRSHARGVRRREARPPAPPGDDPPTPEDQLRARRRFEALTAELARQSGRSRHAVQASLWRMRRKLEEVGA